MSAMASDSILPENENNDTRLRESAIEIVKITESGINLTTIIVKGYGNITVPENYVMDSEEKKEIVAKNYTGKLITPLIEKLPPVKWVTVKTRHGSIQTPASTLEKLGRKEFLKIQEKFFEALKEIKHKEIKISEEKDYNGGTQTGSSFKTLKTDYVVGEWAFFHRKDTSSEPYWLSGKITPFPHYSTGQSFTSYHEREIYLGHSAIR